MLWQSTSRALRPVVLVAFLLVISHAHADEYAEPGTYVIAGDGNEIRVLVYRGGLLGGFGHNHVISTSDISGRIQIDAQPGSSEVHMTFPVDSLEVDIEDKRTQEGRAFEKKVSEKARHGTRKNMLGRKLLDSVDYSNIEIRSRYWSGQLPDILVIAEFTVRDQTNTLEFPAEVSVDEERIVIAGRFTVTHGQLGLKPFTAVLGTLRVRDEMELKFRITARRILD
ncbi:MAG: YceI family protein [Woeseia sp.]